MDYSITVKEFKEQFLDKLQDDDKIIISDLDQWEKPICYPFIPEIAQYSDEKKTRELVLRVDTSFNDQ